MCVRIPWKSYGSLYVPGVVIALWAAGTIRLPAAPSGVESAQRPVLVNPGFEEGLRGWRITGDAAAVAIESVDGAHGRCVRLAPRNNVVGVETAELLRDGEDVDLFDTWELRARVRIDSVTRGTFNALLYCYDVAGRYVAMKAFFSAPAPQKPQPWRTVRLTFGPEGSWQPPPEVALIKVRFSFWAPDRRCTGTVWVDDVALTRLSPPEKPALSGKAPAAECIALWRDPALARRAACDLDMLENLARTGGRTLERIATDDLCNPEMLTPRRFSLVILPYGAAFPVEARTALLRYLRRGGDLAVIGGAAFEEPLVNVHGRWGGPEDFLDWSHSAKIADFDRAPVFMLSDHRAPDARGRAEVIGPGANGTPRALRYVMPAPSRFEYVGFKSMTDIPENAALTFHARGDEQTHFLCVEAQDTGGGRWKAVVRLRRDWRLVTLHTSDFFAYARAKTGAKAGRFHPEHVVRLYFGVMRAMQPAPGAFWIDEIGWTRCALPPDDARRRHGLAPMGRLEAAFFGRSLIDGADQGGPWTLYDPQKPERKARIFEAARTVAPHGPPGFQRVALDRPTPFRVIGALEPLDRPKRNGPHVVSEGVLEAPLVRTTQSVVATLRLWTGWPFPGATCTFIGMHRWDLANPALRRLTSAAFAFSARGTAAVDVRPVFTAGSARCSMAARITLLNNSSAPAAVRVHCRWQYAGCTGGHDGNVVLQPESIERFDVGVRTALERLSEPYRLEAFTGADSRRVARVTVDVRTVLKQTADWFVDRQRADGRFSGVSFIDSRAARGLFAAGDVLDEPRYTQAALKWADAMLAAQRPDGGYRMGYGDKQGICYVADGGEIAMGVARAMQYARGKKRERYRRSLEAYMKFRESFRNREGGIGIGWCLHDYIDNKKFDRLTREMRSRPFTLGCTLGAAAAMSALGIYRAEDVLADARTFLEEQRLIVGVSAEGLMWVHRYVPDPGLRREVAERLRNSLIEFTANQRSPWWTGSGGRYAVTLAVLAYAWTHFGRDPRILAAIRRAEWALCGTTSPYALHHVANRPEIGHDDWIYLCYSLVSLPELLRPGVTLAPF